MAFRAGGMNIGDFLGGLRNNISGLQQGMPEAPGPAAGNMSNFAGMNPGGVGQGVAGNFARPAMGAQGNGQGNNRAVPRRPMPPRQGGVLMNAFRNAGPRRF